MLSYTRTASASNRIYSGEKGSSLVGSVVNVGGGPLDQQAGELEQEDAHSIRSAKRVFRVDDSVDKHTDNVVWGVPLGLRGTPDELLPIPVVEGGCKCRHQQMLQHLGQKGLREPRLREGLHETEERRTFPLHLQHRTRALHEAIPVGRVCHVDEPISLAVCRTAPIH